LIASARPIFWSSVKSQPLCGSRPILREPLASTLEPVSICRCASLHRILQGVKCAAQTITAVPAAGMARKRSYHLQPRCWNEHRWFNFSGEFQTALLNWLCKARRDVVVSLHNFLCIVISRSLSNLKLKYTTVVVGNWGLRGPALFFVCLLYHLLNDAQNCIGIPHPRAPCLSQGPSVFLWVSLSVLILESLEQEFWILPDPCCIVSLYRGFVQKS